MNVNHQWDPTLWRWIFKKNYCGLSHRQRRSSARQQYPEHTNVNITRSPHEVMWPSLAYSIQRDRFSNRLLFSNRKHWQSCVDSSSLRSWLSDLQPNLSLKSQHATCLMAETRQLHGDVDDGITATRGQSFNKYRGSDRSGEKLLGTPWGCRQTFG